MAICIFKAFQKNKGPKRSNHNYFDIDQKFNEEKAAKQKELDRILDKITKKGTKNLTDSEKQFLDTFSK